MRQVQQENIQMLGVNVQILDALSTWSPGFLRPWFSGGCKSFFKNVSCRTSLHHFVMLACWITNTAEENVCACLLFHFTSLMLKWRGEGNGFNLLI